MRVDEATGDAPRANMRITSEERAAAALHNALAGGVKMPEQARARLSALASNLGQRATVPRKREVSWVAAAAVVLLVGAIAAYAFIGGRQSSRELAAARAQLAEMQTRFESNSQIIAESQRRVEEMGRELARLNDATAAQAAAAAQRQTEMAAQLAAASARLTEHETSLAQAKDKERELTRELSEARLSLVKYREPVDPATLAQNRTKLLEMPGTIRIAWAPFDLPDAPAEQRTVQGDVIWNDTLQTGYLRFVGLQVNDPAKEQYQVWVLDERGMEQRVSGGIFNATAAGEVIVPIEPGINLGRVALFAVTVEKPGGTWISDLKRRIVVAPRS